MSSPKQLALIVNVSDVSGCGYDSCPDSADKVFVPADRLLELATELIKLKEFYKKYELSELRKLDYSVTFFDSSTMPDDREELYPESPDAEDWFIADTEWIPEEADHIEVQELKVLDCGLCWCCLVGSDGPTSLESNLLSDPEWTKILKRIKS